MIIISKSIKEMSKEMFMIKNKIEQLKRKEKRKVDSKRKNERDNLKRMEARK